MIAKIVGRMEKFSLNPQIVFADCMDGAVIFGL